MRGMADKAFAAGFNVIRLNQRNCGGTEHLAAGLYHSGLTHDADVRAARGPGARRRRRGRRRRLFARRQSRAEAGRRATATRRRRSCARSAPCRRSWSSKRACSALERRSQLPLPVELRPRPEGADAAQGPVLSPTAFPSSRLGRIRTVRQFDEAYTAPHFGFASAEDYYHRASAMRVADRIRVPALVITAADDPFVPAEPFRDPAAGAEPVRPGRDVTPHGGHCGFLERGGGGADGYWAERRIVEFAKEVCGAPPRWQLDCGDAAARPRRHLRLQLPGMARHVLPREVQHRQDAGVLRRALPHRRDQLHVLPHAQREAAGRLERRHARRTSRSRSRRRGGSPTTPSCSAARS